MKLYQQFAMTAVAVALLAPAAAHADNAQTRQGWYAGAEGIASLQSDAKSKVRSDGVKNKIDYDAGWGLGGNVGYSFGKGYRAEGEVSYRRSGDVNAVSGTRSGSAAGHIRNIAVMANGYYDVETGTRFTPYVGAGIGVSVVDAFNIRTVDGKTLDSERPAFAYQGIVGLATALDSHWVLDTDYRYFRTTRANFKSNDFDRAKTENASHNIVVGLTYKFGGSAAKPAPAPAAAAPVPTPAPVAAPAVPVVPQSFMVFFDFDQAKLTPEAKRIIAAAAEDYKKGKYVRLVVTGHTDTMGTAPYNKKLSIKRADAVKAEMVKLGVPASVVEASGAGKSSLLVPTADSVREAQNRRAEIVLSK